MFVHGVTVLDCSCLHVRGFFCHFFKQSHLVLLVSAMEWLTFFLCFILQVHIVCRLHHDQLKPVFHVCRRLQQAVSRVF